jgi:hypothetical protein
VKRLMGKATGVEGRSLEGTKQEKSITSRLRFDRMELAGSLGDLGMVLPTVSELSLALFG